MQAVINEAEKTLPDGPEKKKILDGLKAVVSNPTFAAIAGAALSEIIKKLLN